MKDDGLGGKDVIESARQAVNDIAAAKAEIETLKAQATNVEKEVKQLQRILNKLLAHEHNANGQIVVRLGDL